jgi:uncharacterized protein
MFSQEVSAQLKYYVYRLIDPRNGETFYVGKGVGNRVFAHVKGELGTEADTLTDKLQRIRDIRLDGFDVAHVIHRHGVDEQTAFEIEAALIDAYPEATSAVAGRASDERGLMHANQIIERYQAKEAVFEHKAILINVNRSAAEKDSVYGFTLRVEARSQESAKVRHSLSGIAGTYHRRIRGRRVAGRDAYEFPRHLNGSAWEMGIRGT